MLFSGSVTVREMAQTAAFCHGESEDEGEGDVHALGLCIRRCRMRDLPWQKVMAIGAMLLTRSARICCSGEV
jgi:hypothetical protein